VKKRHRFGVSGVFTSRVMVRPLDALLGLSPWLVVRVCVRVLLGHRCSSRRLRGGWFRRTMTRPMKPV